MIYKEELLTTYVRAGMILQVAASGVTIPQVSSRSTTPGKAGGPVDLLWVCCFFWGEVDGNQ